jgi:hypothetical protein
MGLGGHNGYYCLDLSKLGRMEFVLLLTEPRRLFALIVILFVLFVHSGNY